MKKYYKLDSSMIIPKMNKVKKLKDIFIIKNKKTQEVVKIYDNGNSVLRFLLKDKDIIDLKEYMLLNILGFCDAIINEKCKYKSFNQKYTVYKYIYLQQLYEEKIINNKPLNSHLDDFQNIKKSKIFKRYMRIKKLKRILDDVYSLPSINE